MFESKQIEVYQNLLNTELKQNVAENKWIERED